MRKICIVTGTRSEYGLLHSLMNEVKNDKKLQLQLIVTGMHLSYEFGLTYKLIEKDGFIIDKKVEMLLSSDSRVGISKSMGLAQIGFAEAYNELKPDLVVVLGDRFEIFSAVISAMIARIPIAHIHGGETTEGVVDEAIRHSITKMAHLHFSATNEYRNRIIQLGENPNRVFNVGGLGIDSIKNANLLSKDEFEKELKFKLNKKNIFIIFHPTTLEEATSEFQFNELISVIDKLENTNTIFVKANADVDGRIINEMIDEYAVKNKNVIAFKSLRQELYLSAMQYVDAIVGNSSSGLLEAPTFKIGTINIGDRQRGRIRAKSVIDCKPNRLEITKAFEILYSNEFQNSLKNVINPYGEGGASKKILQIIKDFPLEGILKKEFWDLS